MGKRVPARQILRFTENAWEQFAKLNPDLGPKLSELVRQATDKHSADVILTPRGQAEEAKLADLLKRADWGGRPPAEMEARDPNTLITDRAPGDPEVGFVAPIYSPAKGAETPPGGAVVPYSEYQQHTLGGQGPLAVPHRAPDYVDAPGGNLPAVTAGRGPLLAGEAGVPPPYKFRETGSAPSGTRAWDPTRYSVDPETGASVPYHYPGAGDAGVEGGPIRAGERVPLSTLAKGAGVAAGIGAVGAGTWAASTRDGEPPVTPPTPEPGPAPEPGPDDDARKKAAAEAELAAAKKQADEKKAAEDRAMAKKLKWKGGVSLDRVYDDAAEQQRAITQLADYDKTKPDVGETAMSDKERTTWESKFASVQDAYKEARRQQQWAEVGEKLGHAIVQLAAAQYGLRTGTDLSGIKFDKTDWERRMDRSLKELDLDLGFEERRRRERLTEIESARASLEKWQAGRAHLQERQSAERAAGMRTRGDAAVHNATSLQQHQFGILDLEYKTAKDKQDAADMAAKQDAALAAKRKADADKYGAAYGTEVNSLDTRLQTILLRLSSAKKPQDEGDPDVKAAGQLWTSSGLGTADEFAQLRAKADEGIFRDATSRDVWTAGARQLLEPRIEGLAKQRAAVKTQITPVQPAAQSPAPAAGETGGGEHKTGLSRSAQQERVAAALAQNADKVKSPEGRAALLEAMKRAKLIDSNYTEAP